MNPRLRAAWCVCSWRSAPWCLLDNLLACRVRWGLRPSRPIHHRRPMMSTLVPVNTMTAILCAQQEWRGMTAVQRERLADFNIMRTHPATERCLNDRGLIEGEAWSGADLTSWGRYVLHVHDPKRYQKPERVEIPQSAIGWLVQRAEAASRDRQG